MPSGPLRVTWVNNYDLGNAAQPQFFLVQPSQEALTNAATLPGLADGEKLPKHTAFPGTASPEPAVMAPLVDPAAASIPSASPPIFGFDTQDFDDNATLTGFRFIPPDPHGTVGPNHVIAVNNVAIGAYTKAGANVFLQSLQTFFGSPTFTFDPKAIYDQFTNRYLVVTLEQVEAGTNPSTGNESRILLAASPVGTPVGTWTAVSIDSKITTTSPSRDYWCDYPGFAVDEEAIYVSCNHFAFAPISASLGSRLYTIDKAALYAGTFNPATDLNLYDPGTASGVSSCTFTLQPAHVHSDPGGTIGTWLTAFSGCSSAPAGTPQFLHIIRIDNPLGGAGASFTGWFPALGAICSTSFCSVADAPQPSLLDLDTVGNRTYDAEWRNGNLFVTTTTTINEGGTDQATAHWFQMNTATLAAAPANSSPPITNQGDVGAEDLGTGTYTYSPSISVNDDCALLGFAASSSSLAAGAYYAVIDVLGTSGPAGTAGSTQTVRVGDDSYQRTFGGSRNRWGDYSGVVLDFTDTDFFWIFNQYAQTRGSGTPPEDGRWGQRAAQESCQSAGLPVELSHFSAVLDGDLVTLSWRTASETNNAGFEVQHRYYDGVFEPVGFVEGHGTTLEPRDYRYQIRDIDPGRYVFRLKQVDYDGTFEYSPEVEVFVDLPEAYALSDAYPNPFNPETQFTLTVTSVQHVTVEVFDVTGRRVALLHDGLLDADQPHGFTFDARHLPSGLYMYRVTGEQFSAVKSMMLLK